MINQKFIWKINKYKICEIQNLYENKFTINILNQKVIQKYICFKIY